MVAGKFYSQDKYWKCFFCSKTRRWNFTWCEV